jgi:ketosteroid isomerase-like protein
MRKRWLAGLLLVAISVPLWGRDRAQDAATVERAARTFLEAWSAGDVRTVESLLARQYTHTTVDGTIQDRDEWLQSLRDRKERYAATLEDVHVEVFGDVAVLTASGTLQIAGTTTGGRARYTQVWIRENGSWKRRFFQGTWVRKQP